MAINLSNGVVLPDIPVLSDYPYNVIYKSLNVDDGTVRYILMPTSSKSMYVTMETSGEVCDSILFTGNATGYEYDSELNEWVLSLEDTDNNNANGLLIPIRQPPSSSSNVMIVPVWMDYEMMVAAKDSNGNYIETNTVANIIETQVVYNNVTLPSAVVDMSGQYPYTSILTIPTNDGIGYYLIAGTTKGLYIPPELLGETYGAAYLEGTCKIYMCAPSIGMDSWVFMEADEAPGEMPLQGFSVLWANYDIMIAKKDASGNYIASDVIYDYIIDMIDYNGVLLPELPSSDLEYAIIIDATKSGEVNGYILLLCKTKSFVLPMSKLGQGPYDLLMNENEYLGYLYTIGSASWTLMESGSSGLQLPLNYSDIPLSIQWSNYNIMEVFPFGDSVGNIELGIYFPPASLTEKPLPDIEHTSDYYAVSADFMSSIAREARRLSGNFTRMTPDGIIDTFTNTGSYRKLFNKTIEKIDFELPAILYPYTFAGCSQLKTVSSEKPIIIGEFCFGSCSSLESVSLPNAIIIANGSGFVNCSSLTSIEIPSVVEIDSSSFSGCSSLTSINLPNLTTIGSNSFYNCIALTDINIPNVNIIENYGFERCESLPTINLPKAQILGYGSFMSCNALTTINTPKAIEIQDSTFSNCTSLNKVDLPSCISLGSTNYTNNNRVFYNCTSLDTLILRSPKKCAMMGNNSDMFYNTPIAKGTGYIYVPSALLNSYKTDSSWSTYSNQFRAIESYPDVCGTDPLPTMWTSGSKDITNQLQQGQIYQYSPYISSSNTRVSYVGIDLVVKGGDVISVEVPSGYKFGIHTLGDQGYTQTIRKNYVNKLDSGWLSKGSTYTIPELVNNRPSHIIWVTIAKTTDTETINISELGTITVTKVSS